ncbi:hypothetical protein F5Y13DRAFT_196174 [Hypoxylon sp. FL1857]|nr:hypothetical protein F5Y13DRAFT_196174 [Hypoxylon sp. FL1857]
MAPVSRFLSLPRELRDAIYEYYVSWDGYTYDFQTRTLKTTEGDPIDLALMFTCWQVACEMKGVALRNNPITFRTIYSEETRRSAYSYAELLQYFCNLKRAMFKYARPCFTEDLRSKVAQLYPDFMHVFDMNDIDYKWGVNGAGYMPSVIHSATDYTLELASSHSQFPEAMSQFEDGFDLYWRGIRVDHKVLNSVRYEPWRIPTEDEILQMAKACGFRQGHHRWRWTIASSNPIKYYFSATAACIQFLESIPASTRAEIRKIVIDEDHPSIGNPAGHARGLIPFCKENPRLKIERRANLWRNVFLGSLLNKRNVFSYTRVYYPDIRDVTHQLSATMTGSISLWAMEALALIPAGMPQDSFCLVFDGDPEPSKSSELFQHVIQQDATWQAAMEECVRRGFLGRFDFLKNEEFRYDCYFYRGFPKALCDIVNRRSSIIRCNFGLGTYSLSHLDSLVEERREWTLEQWRKDWYDRKPDTLITSCTMLGWMNRLDEMCEWTFM